MAEKYLVTIDDEDATFELRQDEGGLSVRRDEAEEWKSASLERVGDSPLYLLMVDDRPTELYIERRRGGAIVTIGRHQFNIDVGPWRPVSKRAGSGQQQAGISKMTAPMTGSIVEVRCEVGQQVSQGDVLLVMESMKMNNELRATASGVVETVGVKAGQRVSANELLVAIRSGDQ